MRFKSKISFYEVLSFSPLILPDFSKKMNMIQATFHVHVYQALADNLRHGYLSFDLYKDTPSDQFLFISSASKLANVRMDGPKWRHRV